MDEGNLYGDLAINTLVTIIIFLVIICAAPLFAYLLTFGFNRGLEDDYSLVKEFAERSNELDIAFNSFNTFQDLYLYCSYIPYKKLKMCKTNVPEEILLYNVYLNKIYNIREKLNDLKTYCNGESYNSIKEDSDKFIAKNKADRINREHSENLVGIKEIGKNKRAWWKNAIQWAKRISSWFYSFLNINELIFIRKIKH